ncbi:MAG: carbonic anhydrase [Thermosynechococcaceae cyanobacterium]
MNGTTLTSALSRRRMLQFGAGLVGSGVAAASTSALLGHPEPAIAGGAPIGSPPDNITPDEAIRRLMDGNQRFTTRKLKYPNQDFARLEEVAKGQKPFAAILGCADSRVPSELVFDQGLGDLFVCRVAGNVAIEEEIGSLEFGTAVLGAKVIVVLGHERCGAVEATMKGAAVPGRIGSLLDAIRPSLERAKGQPGDALENSCKANIAYQIEQLKTSPVLSDRIAAGTLKIVGGYYDLDTGTVSMVS